MFEDPKKKVPPRPSRHVSYMDKVKAAHSLVERNGVDEYPSEMIDQIRKQTRLRPKGPKPATLPEEAKEQVEELASIMARINQLQPEAKRKFTFGTPRHQAQAELRYWQKRLEAFEFDFTKGA